MTVRELRKECERLIIAGFGDKEVMISADDEGNDYHYLYYSFVAEQDEIDEILECCCGHYRLEETNNIVLLG